MKFILGAYASAPSMVDCDKKIEKEFYELILKNDTLIGGLEIPFWDTDIHKFGSNFIINFLNISWKNVLTCVPLSFLLQKKYLGFGLASSNENARLLALKKHKLALNKIKFIADYFGKNVFFSVNIASGPYSGKSNQYSNKHSFQKSLDELCSWDWQGTQILIEHCDSVKNGYYEKGFLNIEDEIYAIEKLKEAYKVKFSLNWGRSAIEGRNPNYVLEHIKILKKVGLLNGFIFSGTSNKDTIYGDWKDNHMPFNKIYNIQNYEKNSLLTYLNVKNTLQRLSKSEIQFIGVKILSLPLENLNVEKRVDFNIDALRILRTMVDEINFQSDNYILK